MTAIPPKSPVALLLVAGAIYILSRRAIVSGGASVGRRVAAGRPGGGGGRSVSTANGQHTTADPVAVAGRFAGGILSSFFGTVARATPTADAATSAAQDAVAGAGASYQWPAWGDTWGAKTQPVGFSTGQLPGTDGGLFADAWTRPSFSTVNPFTAGVFNAPDAASVALSDSIPAAPLFDPSVDTNYWGNALP